jgi:hypothetical protein
MIANTPPTVLLAEGWSLIIPSAVDRGDKPSRPGQAGQDRSSSRALHLDRLGLARSLAGGSMADGMISKTGVRRSARRSCPLRARSGSLSRYLTVNCGHTRLAPTWDVAGWEAARNTLIRMCSIVNPSGSPGK